MAANNTQESESGIIKLHDDPPQAFMASLAFQYTHQYDTSLIANILGGHADDDTILRFHIDVAMIAHKYWWRDLELVAANDLWKSVFNMPDRVILSAANYFRSAGAQPRSVANVFSRVCHLDVEPITMRQQNRNEWKEKEYQYFENVPPYSKRYIKQIPFFKVPIVRESYGFYWGNRHLSDVKFAVLEGDQNVYVVPAAAEGAVDTLDPKLNGREILYCHRGILAKSCGYLHGELVSVIWI
jgi:hypothetical protein